ncbi:hypothetical protein Cni_G02878 [Canna indica]|uniref:Glycosyltransferase 61 catalytic domain-containing protein n=1 Tax=Canna indica TaxID=4628 RepID=A0AAQ3JQE0_9LILI|nr:hypothetical protein Cni_G02878 [Canna indica]
MASKPKPVRNVNPSRRFRFIALIFGCFVVIAVTFFMVSKPQTPFLANEINNEKNDPVFDSSIKEDKNIHELAGTTTETENGGTKSSDLSSNQDKSHNGLALIPTHSNYTIHDQTQEDSKIIQLGEQIQILERKPLCDVSDPRTDICEMHGDIRIHGSSSSVIFTESSTSPKTQHKESWRIHPYPRKGDATCFARVRELTVEATSNVAPECTATHRVPAVVFSTGGYAGNLFHDFTDLLVPLFATARQFDGEVMLAVTDLSVKWMEKYRLVLEKISNYPVIDLDEDKQVNCFAQVIVGLRAYNEFHIDPARTPNGYTILDFTKFMRSTFSVQREAPLNIEDFSGRRPRLVIIARRRTRAFTNTAEIVATAEELGYEAVVADTTLDLARFARVVNSGDVMMGVHGAGLANMVFLPPNATLIQVVPWGGLEWMATVDFGSPAEEMGLKYEQYSIGVEESSLREQYPREHAVFTDPMSFHRRGFHVLRSTFLENQNVRLDVGKFRDVLWRALENVLQ